MKATVACLLEAGPYSQGLRFGGTKHIFEGEGFLFLLHVWNKFFWAVQNLGVTAPLPHGNGPAWEFFLYF